MSPLEKLIANTARLPEHGNLRVERILSAQKEYDWIQISHLGVYYRTQEALSDINCMVKPGKLTGIFGPNGAGKSTMLKAMLGLVPSNGVVLYQGELLRKQLEKVAYVPQRSQIDWTYPATVWDVVMMGRVKKTGWLRNFSTVSRRVVKNALVRVGMIDYRHRPIGQLSGGQQQRVFLARALAQEAELLILDEPFNGVDQKTESIMFDIFRELKAQSKILFVISHDLSETLDNYDQLLLLNKRVIAQGARHEVMTKDNLLAAYDAPVWSIAP